MKKNLLRVFAIVLALAIAAVTVFAWRIGDVASAYKPLLEKKLSEALGAEATFGDLSLSLFPKPALRVTDVTIKGNAGQSPGVALRSLSAGASLLPLLKKRLVLSAITLDQPIVTLIKSPQGVAIRGVEAPARSPAASDSKPAQVSSPAPQNLPLDIAIERIVVHNGTLILDEPHLARSTKLNRLELDAALSLAQSEVKVPDAALSFETGPSLPITIEVTDLLLNQTTKSVTLSNALVTTPAGAIRASGNSPSAGQTGTVALTTDGLDIAKLKSMMAPVAPNFSGLPASGSARADIRLSLSHERVSALKGPITLSGISLDLSARHRIRALNADLSVDGSPEDLAFAIAKASLQYNNTPLGVTADGRIRTKDISVHAVSVKGFGGQIQAPLRLDLSGSPTLAIKPSASSLSIQSLLKAIDNPAASVVSGTISSCNGDFNSIALNNPAQTTSGPGAITIKDGIIKGMNLPNQVLTKIEGLPFIADSLRKRVPPEFDSILSKPDTVIRELNSRFSIRSGVVSISDLFLASDLFNLKGSGTYALTGQVGLEAQILFSPEFSKALIARVKELQPLVNPDGRLVFPIAVQGTIPAVIVTPDLKGLAKSVSVDALKQTIGEALKGKKGLKKDLGKIFGF
jgi:uncharacterized protein involved in outer membrane biogenesis